MAYVELALGKPGLHRTDRVERAADHRDQHVIYGAMAAVIVVPLTLEAAAVILLFGGQVIEEIDRARVGRARARP